MNRHYLNGYQRNFINDLYHVEERLQEYDPHLYIMHNTKDGTWMVMDGLMEMAIMKVPQAGFETLDGRIVSHIKKIHVYNGFNAVHEVERSLERMERDQQQKLDDISQDFAKEMFGADEKIYSIGRV